MNLLDSITKFLESTGFAILGNEGGLAAFRTVVMLVIACVLVYLAIVKGFEPLLLASDCNRNASDQPARRRDVP